MTIKQLLVGTLIGATALGAMLHRLSKQPIQASPEPHLKVAAKPHARALHSSRKHRTDDRLSLNKIFG